MTDKNGQTQNEQKEAPVVTPESTMGGRIADLEAQAKAAREAEAKTAAEAKAREESEARAAAKAKEAEGASTDGDADQSGASEDEGQTGGDNWKNQWVATGNEHADAAIELMKEAGIKPVEGNDIFAEAIEKGDLKLVKWDILESRIGKAKASLVRAGVQQYFDGEYKQQMATQTYAYEKVGGAEGWAKVQKWAKAEEGKNAEFAGKLNDYRKALSIGGFAAQAAIDAIKTAYEADPKNGSIGGKELERGTRTPKSSVGEPLSRAAYVTELRKAGGDRAPADVQAALWARRQAGAKAGL